jgi:hypothetical protein
MNEQLFGATLGIITTLIGGVFGFLLSEISTRRREVRQARALSESVRLILGLEIERNLDSVKTVWEAISGPAGDQTGDRRKIILAERWALTPSPPFSRDSFKAQLNLFPAALSTQKIRAVFHIYDSLSQLENFRAELISALADQQSELSKFRQSQTAPGQAPGIVYAPRRPFDSKAEMNWDTIEKTLIELVKSGNPLTE